MGNHRRRRCDRYGIPGAVQYAGGWAEGYLGKALAIAAFVTGAIVGFAKSTAMPALIGIVFAIVFGLGPTIINGMFAAVI